MGGPFDLERFAPNPYFQFKLRSDGPTFRVFADPDVDQVARMLRLEQRIAECEMKDELADAIVEAKQLLIELMADADPAGDFSDFKIGNQQMLAIFKGIMHGESVAQAVLEGIAAESLDVPSEGEKGESGALQHDAERDGAAEGADVDPLPSEKPSSEPSLRSGETADTRQAIGTA